jgi:hypothetical protein
VSTLVAAQITDARLLSWVAGSILVCVVAANFLWLLRSAAWLQSPYGRVLSQLGRFLYYLAIPYLVLGGWHPEVLGWQSRPGLLALADMGLVGLSPQWPPNRWLESAGTGLAVGLLALVLLWLAWITASRMWSREQRGRKLSFGPRPWWAVLVNGLYLEIHWAFYRGGLAVTLDDLYAGVLVGFAAVCLEWLLNPFWRAGWQKPSQAGQVWLEAGLALTSALLFLLTRNLWVCLAIHWLLALAFSLFARQRVLPLAGHSSLSGLHPKGPAATQGEDGAQGHEPSP